MFTPAFMTIGRLLLLGLGSLQSVAPIQVQPLVQQSVSAQSAAANQSQSLVRDYVSGEISTNGSSVLSPADPAETTVLSSEELALVEETNQDRESAGLADLDIDTLLCAVARGHSADMAERQYFDHIAPGEVPQSPMDRYLAALGARPAYAFLGENIYYRSVTETGDISATEANTAFMHSAGHRANILQPKFTKMGVGFYRDPSTGAFWVTEMFLTLSPSK